MSSGGGGGSTTTTSSGIDPEFKPYLKRVISDVTDRYDVESQDPSQIVAQMNPYQIEALQRRAELGRDAYLGRGMYDTRAESERTLKNLLGKNRASTYGTGTSGYGSARQDKAIASAMADKALELEKDRQAMAQMGLMELGEVGSIQQQYQQQLLDAPHEAASRYFGYLGATPQQAKQISSGGGK